MADDRTKPESTPAAGPDPAGGPGAPAQLATPILLLAMPQVLDPFFHKSVVLLIHHDQDEGSLGFIVNRHTRIKLADVFTGLEIPWHGDDRRLAHFGGPVQPQIGTVLYGSDPETADDNDIFPGVAMTQHVTELERLADAPPDTMRLYLGYAGWGDGQLEREIRRNDWLTAPVRRDLVFGDDPDIVWRQACASIGVDPDALPSWTQDDGADDALSN